ncbi:unnamed protein product [Schistocephalus solidus]|uniref:Carboxylic ester hydrolase n=1 Tax=Schistocephalus solidus TaxID=70667 RepID=A0A183SQE2_SCHSO|nr:unnamed protein product [Schistocephalus solidus]
MKLLALLFFAYISTNFCLVKSKTILGTTYLPLPQGGTLIGLNYQVSDDNDQFKEVHAFLGIPFAQAPIGEFRFAPPKPVEPEFFAGLVNATKLPNSCWQYLPSEFDKANPGARIWLNNTEMSEDCLYLNVWKPAASTSRLPVMVWIFGGGFFSGTATLDVYSGLQLAARENVIVVSMQYRLGAFGFLYLSPEKRLYPRAANGNMGLLDQQLALKWVHDNIASFGGDPTGVTIFGESAGAASVGLHYLSPTSRPLFSRMIMQSSSFFSRWALIPPSAALERSRAFAKGHGCLYSNQTKVIECLQKLPPLDLVNGINHITEARTRRREKQLAVLFPPTDEQSYEQPSLYLTIEFSPTIDGVFLPYCPEKIISDISRDSEPAPQLLIGTNGKEGMYWLLYGLGLKGIQMLEDNGQVNLPTMNELERTNLDVYRLWTAKFTSEEYLIHPFSAAQISQYGYNSRLLQKVSAYKSPLPMFKADNSTQFMDYMDRISADMEFVCGTIKFAQLIAQLPRGKVQFYHFLRKTKNNGFPDWTGAMHGYEIEYVFGMPFFDEFREKFYNFTDEERQLSRKIMRYWANFARTGDATPASDGRSSEPRWPFYDLEKRQYMELDTEIIVKSGLRDAQCNFWNNVLPTLARTYLLSNLKRPLGDICPNMEPYLYEKEALEKFVPGVNLIIYRN